MTDPNLNSDPSTDPKDSDPGNQNPPGGGGKGSGPEDDEGDEDSDDWTPPDRATVEKLERTARRRDAALRKAQARIAELEKSQREGDPKEPADDPVARANAKLVRAEARTALAAAGVTDREDQKAVLEILNLSGIEVDDDGPDPDAVADLVDTLRRVFGGRAGDGKSPRPRTPRVDTRDRGGSKTPPADPDADRYARILRRR